MAFRLAKCSHYRGKDDAPIVPAGSDCRTTRPLVQVRA